MSDAFDRYYHRDNIPDRLIGKLSIQDMRELAQPLAGRIAELEAQNRRQSDEVNFSRQRSIDDGKRIEELEAENAKLLDRERELNEHGRMLKIENAKLRDAINDYLRYAKGGALDVLIKAVQEDKA
jgi:hypothetical protein